MQQSLDLTLSLSLFCALPIFIVSCICPWTLLFLIVFLECNIHPYLSLLYKCNSPWTLLFLGVLIVCNSSLPIFILGCNSPYIACWQRSNRQISSFKHLGRQGQDFPNGSESNVLKHRKRHADSLIFEVFRHLHLWRQKIYKNMFVSIDLINNSLHKHHLTFDLSLATMIFAGYREVDILHDHSKFLHMDYTIFYWNRMAFILEMKVYCDNILFTPYPNLLGFLLDVEMWSNDCIQATTPQNSPNLLCIGLYHFGFCNGLSFIEHHYDNDELLFFFN